MPFYSWKVSIACWLSCVYYAILSLSPKISHRNHHLSTGSSESDEVFTCDAHQYNSVNEVCDVALVRFYCTVSTLSLILLFVLLLWCNSGPPCNWILSHTLGTTFVFILWLAIVPVV